MAAFLFYGVVSLIVLVIVCPSTSIPKEGIFVTLLTFAIMFSIAAMDDGIKFGTLFGYMIGIIFGWSVYLVPSIVAEHRNHHSSLAIYFTNVFLGWTVIGWIVAIIWSGTSVRNN